MYLRRCVIVQMCHKSGLIELRKNMYGPACAHPIRYLRAALQTNTLADKALRIFRHRIWHLTYVMPSRHSCESVNSLFVRVECTSQSTTNSLPKGIRHLFRGACLTQSIIIMYRTRADQHRLDQIIRAYSINTLMLAVIIN